ncbi:fb124d18-d113-4d36-8e44-4087545a0d13 [Thermothielavioides terrestris]|uniref:Fb124d18-d113-4d36-8e44-4087545a0d13 n=1 Tax=Thermothielavioides terrestris TaxID=2587410 RepID=A0A3S4F3I6_9PEZI|nr:fb124d18-d113-4d36-8e44-4087545a0d13 [Thermothielavioides terrestris]
MARQEGDGRPSTRAPDKTQQAAGKDGGRPGGTEESQPESAEEKKPSRVAALFTKLGLDAPTVLTMFKGSLPPTIGIAMCHAPVVASYFITLGYLVPVISVFAMAIMPRGKFMMNLLLSLLAVCFGSAVSMLALWSAVQARLHTTPVGTPPTATPTYNSSQSAVCAVWLFANIWFGNVVRAKLPAFNLPIIVYSILVNVSATFGPIMTTSAAAQLYMQELLTAMLTALALAFGVNLLVFPVSSRVVVFKELADAMGLLRRLVALQKEYLSSLETDATPNAASHTETFLAKGDEEADVGQKKPSLTKEAEAAKALEETGSKLRELAGKLHADLPFAKRDIAWGKLDAKDLSEVYTLFRHVYIPVLGMNTIIDIIKRFSEHSDWENPGGIPDETAGEKDIEKRVWNEVMKEVHEPFEILSKAVDHGLEHAAMCLGLVKRPKKRSNPSDADVEAGAEPMPGDPGFARVLDNKVQAFYSRKGELLRKWVEERGINFDAGTAGQPSFRSERDQVQLYIIVYLENLMHAAGEAVQDLVDFADEKIQDGTMSKHRLITPTVNRLRKWVKAVFSSEDSSAEQTPDAMETGANIVDFGGGYNRKRDPEHLPPKTAWERFGNGLRKIPKFFGSEESAFGFRVACATMTIGIAAFLESTQRFFREQRLVWAMVIVSLSMTMTSGQSFFGFLCRIGGTIIAMCLSLIVWYIVDGHVPGVIVLLWLSIFINYYFIIKFPRFLTAILITIVTQVLIINYELQVLAIGRAAAERTGQPVHPTYLLAPYRVACVAGGSLIAFIWTIFPSPLTDRTWLRRDLSATLYLLANYFGVISSSLRSNVRGTAGDINMPGSPAHHLHKVSRKIYGKVMMLVPSMSQHSEWQRWEPTVGGKFPRETYHDIITRSTRIMAYLTLISYTIMHPTRVRLSDVADRGDPDERRPRRSGLRGASLSLHTRSSHPSASPTNREWLGALADVLDILKPTHHTILSTLTLLSNSLLSGQSLPPFLPLPRPYEMTRQFMRMRQSALATPDRATEDVADGAPITMVDSRTGRADDSCHHHPDPDQGVRRRHAVANILDPRNVGQPGYAEFAVLQL